MTDDLNGRLAALSKSGWVLRICYTLRRRDKKDEASWQSYHADTLQSVVKRVEQEVRTPKRPVEAVEPQPKEEEANERI